MNRCMLIGRERLLAETFQVFINMHLVQARKVAEVTGGLPASEFVLEVQPQGVVLYLQAAVSTRT